MKRKAGGKSGEELGRKWVRINREKKVKSPLSEGCKETLAGKKGCLMAAGRRIRGGAGGVEKNSKFEKVPTQSINGISQDKARNRGTDHQGARYPVSRGNETDGSRKKPEKKERELDLGARGGPRTR